MIEAHIMLDGDDVPLDSGHSYLPKQFSEAAKIARVAAEVAFRYPAEPEDVEFRRRWHYAHDMPAGATVGPKDIVALRSAVGISVSCPPPVGWVLRSAVKKHQPWGG